MDARSIQNLLIVFIVALLSGHSAWGQEQAAWWKPSSWLKTSETDSSVRKSSFFENTSSDKTDKSLFSMPWSSSEKATTKPAGPSMFEKMGQSTKHAWNSTVDFLNPFDSKPTTTQQGYQPQNVRKTTTQGTGMFGWMWREEKIESPGSVNEFLRQERPKF